MPCRKVPVRFRSKLVFLKEIVQAIFLFYLKSWSGLSLDTLSSPNVLVLVGVGLEHNTKHFHEGQCTK